MDEELLYFKQSLF